MRSTAIPLAMYSRERKIERQRPTDTKTETDRQTDRQAYRQTDRDRERSACLTDLLECSYFEVVDS